MSRIGAQPIVLPDVVTITTDSRTCTIRGPLGELKVSIPEALTVSVDDGIVRVARHNDETSARSYHGLVRTLIANMIEGVSHGFTQKLELHGVGYRATINDHDLVLHLGYSHPIVVTAPPGITFKVEKNTIVISGIDKAAIGEIAAQIRFKRKPEPYKGKGIRYAGEVVRRKAGKTAKA